MSSVLKLRRRFAVVAITCAAAATLIPATTASSATAYGNLTSQWWKWIYAQPAVDVGGTNTNPILDSNGQFAAAGQANGNGPANKYFFLTGNFGGDTTRTVTIPQGKALFFPIINIEVDNAVPNPEGLGVPALKEQAKAVIDAATNMSAEFGPVGSVLQDVEFFRVVSPTFDYTLVDTNSIYDYFGLVGPQFEGRVMPAIGDGYWAYIAPPAPGNYVLHFHSELPGFSLDVTYNLTIV